MKKQLNKEVIKVIEQEANYVNSLKGRGYTEVMSAITEARSSLIVQFGEDKQVLKELNRLVKDTIGEPKITEVKNEAGGVGKHV